MNVFLLGDGRQNGRKICARSGKRNYSNSVSTTRLTFANNCPAKMLVSVGGRRAAQSDSKQSLFGSRGLFPQSPAKLMTTPGALLACAIVEEGTTKRRSRSKFHRRRRKRRKIERRRRVGQADETRKERHFMLPNDAGNPSCLGHWKDYVQYEGTS